MLNLKSPIERGLITDWDAMEKIWNHTFQQLKVSPDEQYLIQTESPLTKKVSSIVYPTSISVAECFRRHFFVYINNVWLSFL